jgi:guanylate kinase
MDIISNIDEKKDYTCIVIVGASGSGKNTLQELFQMNGRKVVISYTTRPKRNGEIDGVDYHFINKEKFEMMIEDNKFIEYVQYNGNYYGCKESDFLGNDTVIIVDTNGLKQIKEKLSKKIKVISVFLDVPENVRIERMRKRGDDEKSIRNRIELDKKHFSKLDIKLVDVYLTLNGTESPNEIYTRIQKEIEYILITKEILREFDKNGLTNMIYGIKVHQTEKGIEVLILYENNADRKRIEDIVSNIMNKRNFDNWYICEFVSKC